VERAKPQAATKFLSHAGENVSLKTRKPARFKAFSFKYYQLITKLISINGEYFLYIASLYYLTPFYLQSRPTCTIASTRHTDHSVPLQSIFNTADYTLNSKRSSVAPYKVDMMLFIPDNYDVVCSAPHIIVIVNEQHHVKCA